MENLPARNTPVMLLSVELNAIISEWYKSNPEEQLQYLDKNYYDLLGIDWYFQHIFVSTMNKVSYIYTRSLYVSETITITKQYCKDNETVYEHKVEHFYNKYFSKIKHSKNIIKRKRSQNGAYYAKDLKTDMQEESSKLKQTIKNIHHRIKNRIFYFPHALYFDRHEKRNYTKRRNWLQVMCWINFILAHERFHEVCDNPNIKRSHAAEEISATIEGIYAIQQFIDKHVLPHQFLFYCKTR